MITKAKQISRKLAAAGEPALAAQLATVTQPTTAAIGNAFDLARLVLKAQQNQVTLGGGTVTLPSKVWLEIYKTATKV